jgi:hypothetical protein
LNGNSRINPIARRLNQGPAPKNLSQFYGRIVPGSTVEDDLVQQNLPLVRQVVGRLAMSMPAHVDQDDLYSSGLVGLLNAVRNYDPQGWQFV